MDAWRTNAIEEVCSEYEAKRLDWSFDAVYGLIEHFPMTGHMDFYEEGQDDEGQDDQGDQPWNDAGDPSPAESDNEGQRGAPAPAEPEDFDEAQREELQSTQGKLKALDQAYELADTFPQVQRSIEDVRNQVIKQATGRSQQDSAIARAIRRQEQLARDLSTQRLQAEQQRRRSSEAQQKAVEDTLASIDGRIKAAVQRESKRGEGEPAREADAAKARRAAIQAAPISFRLDELGQGSLGCNPRHQQNRFTLISRVFDLGDLRPPAMAAMWKVWLHRLDKEGRRRYTVRWAACLQHQMADLVTKLTNGESGACLEWHRRLTREWALNAGALVVPASGASASSAPAGIPLGSRAR